MVSSLAFQLFLGKPLIMYGGILTFLSLLFTVTIGALNRRGITVIPFKWHPRMAVLTIVIGVIHALFGLSVFFKF